MPTIKEKMNKKKKNMHYSFGANKICLRTCLTSIIELEVFLVINVLLSFCDSLIGIFLICYLS